MIFICFLFSSLLGWQLSWHRRSREEKRELLNYIDTHQVPIKAIDPKICVLRNINYDGSSCFHFFRIEIYLKSLWWSCEFEYSENYCVQIVTVLVIVSNTFLGSFQSMRLWQEKRQLPKNSGNPKNQNNPTHLIKLGYLLLLINIVKLNHSKR